MSAALEAVTTAALSLALEAAARRQQAIAANVANAGTAGHVPLKVSFQGQLEEAREALRSHGTLTPALLESLRPELEPVLDAQGRPGRVAVDVQMAEMAANAVHYQALAQGLSRHLGILATAAADGRR